MCVSTGFVLYLYLQMKELRTQGDENARILQAHLFEGMDSPHGLRHDFREFMLLVCSSFFMSCFF